MPPKPNLILADEEKYVFSESKPASVSEPLIEDWISDSEDENETEFKSKQKKPSFAKIEFVKYNEHMKTPRESIKKVKNNKQAKYPRKNSQSPKGNKRNWNNLMTQKLGILMKSSIKTLNTAGQNFSKAAVSVNTARPINTAYPRPTVNSARTTSNVFIRAHSYVRRPFNKSTTNKNSNLKEKVNTIKGNVTTAWPKATGNPQLELQEKGVIDSGYSRHMTGNKSCLSDYEEVNGGFVVFRGDPKGGKITGKGKISTGRKPALSFMRSFGCPDTILNTIDHLGKFDGKADAGFFVGYSTNNKAFRVPNTEELRVNQDQDANINSTNNINIVSPTVNAVDIENNAIDENIVYGRVDDPNMPNLEEIVYSDDDEGFDAKADMTNLDTHILASPTLTTRIYKDHPLEQIIGDIHSAPQTRRMTNNVTEHVEPKKVIQALQDPSWIEAMQEELLQFKLQQVWTLMDLPHGKRAIGTKWVYKNKKDERGIVIRKRLDFVVYQMDVKSAFLYGKIEEEFYVCQPPRFEDLEFPNKVYKRCQIDKTLFIKRVNGDILLVQVYVDDIIFGSTKKELCTEFEKLMHKKFQMNSMGELTFFLGLQVTQKDDGIFISQDKYVDEILKKFGFSTVKRASTPMDTSKPLLKDEEAKDVDVHLYRSMIRSLMYLTASRPDIMFVVCACARFQVTPKVSHLHVVKRIFRYLKGQPKLGLWYPKNSPFDLEAYTDSDYAGASLDRKSTTGGCQFLRRRLISWQCKKQTIVANSTTKAEYVAASSCCGQVLWIQNQMLDYGYNFMNTKIFIDNESTICIVKNPVFHSKTKHIEIRHHFIRDSYEKRLIQVIKIHTDHNVADLLTKAFDVSRFQYLIASIGMLNL
ncbi:putative ribonuclease H-like domain-containing protein [Tanacetum coccineum]